MTEFERVPEPGGGSAPQGPAAQASSASLVATPGQLPSAPPVGADAEQPPSAPLVDAGMGGRCVSCGAPLASDQRYCVECGARRGKARFGAPTAQPADPARAAAQPPHPRRRLSSSGALVAGIATLLLAMGVGVEIGRLGNGNNNTTPARASSPVQVVTVGGSGGSEGAAAAQAATTTAASNSSSSSSASTSSSANANAHVNNKATPKVTKVIAAKAAQSASKVLGAAAPKNPTVTTGQSCSAGEAGCQNGKFTGNFFGQ
jgi:hypothetical protein